MYETSIPTYVINLKKRVDRNKHILAQFDNRPEFNMSVIHPITHENGAFSLWMTLKKIIENACNNNDELIILCEDDHQFEEAYSSSHLLNCIKTAQQCSCEVLSGGVSCVKSSFPVTDRIFWMEDFTGLQFTILFRRFFKKIIQYDFRVGDDADIVISRLARVKMVIYPFLSTQKEFGYSDVTSNNASAGHVKKLFQISGERIAAMQLVLRYYGKVNFNREDTIDYESIYIPLYLLYRETSDLDISIAQQFNGKKEFEVRAKKEISLSSSDYILQIKEIVEEATAADEDIFIVCKSSHIFSKNYSKYLFLKNVLEAHAQGADLLLGGLVDYDCAVPVAESRFWVMSFTDSEFIVVFRKMFVKIANESFVEFDHSIHPLSEITSHKMLIYPFISDESNRVHSSDRDIGNKKLMLIEPVRKLENIHHEFAKVNEQIFSKTLCR